MAELIFRGVKNPANCSECFFWSICPCLADFDDYSAILDAVHDGNLVRHEKCPVSPLPEGHGNLIDMDAPVQVKRWTDEATHETTVARLLSKFNIVGGPKIIIQPEGGIEL